MKESPRPKQVRIRKQGGFDLIQLLVSLAIGLLITVAAISLYMTNMKMQATNTKMARLNQDARAMMDIMVRDIRRAGFITTDVEAVSPSIMTANPFTTATTDIFTPGGDGTDCIKYTYNRDYKDEAGSIEVDDSDYFGFRLNNANLQMLNSISSANSTATPCANDIWQSITGSDVSISELAFTIVSSPVPSTSGSPPSCVSGLPCIVVRRVEIDLTAKITDESGSSIEQKLKGFARLFNDKYIANP